MHDSGRSAFLITSAQACDSDAGRVRGDEDSCHVGFELLKAASPTILQSAASIAISHHENMMALATLTGVTQRDSCRTHRGGRRWFDALTSERPYKNLGPIEKGGCLFM